MHVNVLFVSFTAVVLMRPDYSMRLELSKSSVFFEDIVRALHKIGQPSRPGNDLHRAKFGSEAGRLCGHSYSLGDASFYYNL